DLAVVVAAPGPDRPVPAQDHAVAAAAGDGDHVVEAGEPGRQQPRLGGAVALLAEAVVPPDPDAAGVDATFGLHCRHDDSCVRFGCAAPGSGHGGLRSLPGVPAGQATA